MAQDYLRVSELNQLIQDVIHAGFPQPVWVCGEIQGYDRNRGKNHIFFELVEKDPESKNIISKVSLVLFSGRKPQINAILKQSENAFALRDDIEVKFACSVDFYPPHGAVRLIVESIDPAFTLGRVAQEKQKLIEQLRKKGVLDKNKQRDLSPVPLNIGLITSDDSAAYNDFYAELRHSGFAFRIFLYNALMQGSKAEKDICQGLERLGALDDLDVIVITRGGGSIADLSCFDSQMIAERIAVCPLPVLCGIGHEINITVADLAAHTYQKTPTAAAQFLVSRVQMVVDDLEDKFEQISALASEKILHEPRRLKENALRLQSGTTLFLKSHREKMVDLKAIIRQRPAAALHNLKALLTEHQKALGKTAKSCLANSRLRLDGYQKVIGIVHPDNTLKRGFSITRAQDGSVLKSIKTLKAGDVLATELADGKVTSSVSKTGAPEAANDGEGDLWLKRNTASPLKG